MKSLEEYVSMAREVNRNTSKRDAPRQDDQINAKTHSGEKVFQPGEVFQVNPEKAKPLNEKKILKETMPPLEGLTEGYLIEWKSPLFGLLTGRVLMVPGDGSILVDHPLNDGKFGPAFIPEDWITRIIETQKSDSLLK